MNEQRQKLPLVRINVPEAQRLADLRAIMQDFETIMQCCSRLEKRLEDKSDYILIESLWIAAVIKYARCFATGKRFGLSQDIYLHLQGEPVKAHQFYIDLRNKHIAHSVNAYEQMSVNFVLSPVDDQEKKIIGIACLRGNHITSGKDGVYQLGSLSKIAHDSLQPIAEKIEQKLLEDGRKLQIDELYKAGEVPVYVAPYTDAANKARGDDGR